MDFHLLVQDDGFTPCLHVPPFLPTSCLLPDIMMDYCEYDTLISCLCVHTHMCTHTCLPARVCVCVSSCYKDGEAKLLCPHQIQLPFLSELITRIHFSAFLIVTWDHGVNYGS